MIHTKRHPKIRLLRGINPSIRIYADCGFEEERTIVQIDTERPISRDEAQEIVAGQIGGEWKIGSMWRDQAAHE